MRDMDHAVIARMRGRVKQMKRLKTLAHDPRMIDIIDRVIAEGEADIAKLEAEQAGPSIE